MATTENTITQQRPRKTEVTRTAYIHEQRKDGNSGLVVTMAYTYNRVNKTLKYGAVLYRWNKDQPFKFDKKQHRSTAVERLQDKAVTINNVEDTSTLKEFEQNARCLLFKHGVCTRKQPTKNQPTQVAEFA